MESADTAQTIGEVVETWWLGPSVAAGESSQHVKQQQIFSAAELVDYVLQHGLCQALHNALAVATFSSVVKRAMKSAGQQYLRLRARRDKLFEISL